MFLLATISNCEVKFIWFSLKILLDFPFTNHQLCRSPFQPRIHSTCQKKLVWHNLNACCTQKSNINLTSIYHQFFTHPILRFNSFKFHWEIKWTRSKPSHWLIKIALSSVISYWIHQSFVNTLYLQIKFTRALSSSHNDWNFNNNKVKLILIVSAEFFHKHEKLIADLYTIQRRYT